MQARRFSGVADDADTRSSLTAAVLVAGLLLGALIVLLRQSILPVKFFADGDFIQSIALGTNVAPADSSYLAVATFYRLLGLAGLPLLASLLGYGAYVVVLLVAAAPLRTRAASSAELLLLGAALLIGAVYIGWYSKDVLVLPITLIALIRSGSRAVDVALLAAIGLYALGFREYWAIVAATFLALRIALAARARLSTLVALAPLLALVLALGIGIVLGVAPDHYRSSVNDGRDITDVQSAITPLLSSGALPLQALDIVLTFVTLLVPLPLLAHGGSYYAVIALALTALWALVVQRARRSFASGRHPVVERHLALLIGFVVVQALFEPDYGSALRHFTPLLPVVVAVVIAAKQRPVDEAQVDSAARSRGARSARTTSTA